MVRNRPDSAGHPGSNSGSGRSPGEGNDNPIPEFLHGKPHGQRCLAGYNPWGRRRLGHNLVTKQHTWNGQHTMNLSNSSSAVMQAHGRYSLINTKSKVQYISNKF